MLVVCEGSKTEPNYLKHVNVLGGAAVVELVIEEPDGTNPTQVVRAAVDILNRAAKREKRTADPNEKFEAAWCVFDVDEHSYIKDACVQARDNGIEVAISNPSVELWFLLHFQDQTAWLDRHEATRLLKAHVPDYEKGNSAYTHLHGRFGAARDRARLLEQRHEGNGTTFPDDNPGSGMWRLIEVIGPAY